MDEPIKNVGEFFAWTKQLKGGLLVYRGMANADWEVSASAYRRIGKLPEERLPIVFQNYIKQLLDNAGLRGFREQQGRNHSDLESLAELQHNGAATCLIDFTTNALIALWFACGENSKQDGTEEDGKVVAMATDNPDRFSIVTYLDLQKPIETFLHQGKLWKWVPSHLSNRIVAQQSVFVFGEGEITEKDYKSIKIDGSGKKNIVKELEERFGITEQYLFSDFTGFALSNAHDRPYSDYTAEDHFHLGLRFQQQGDHKKAIDHYDKGIELNPQYAEAYNNRGIAKADSGDYQGAINDFDKAIELNPKQAGAHNNRGLAKGVSGDYQRAIIDFDKAVELNPQYAKAYYNRGIVKYASGDYQRAIDDYDKAIELNPQYAGAYYNRGITKGASDDYQGAIIDFDKAIELNPKQAEAHNNRGVAKRALGDYQEAIADSDKAIELNPQLAEAYRSRGNAKQDSGDEAGAQEDFAKAKELANKTPK